MRSITVEPLTPEAFAPFGHVLTAPVDFGRHYFDAALANDRAHAVPSVSLAMGRPLDALPLVARRMERHEFSSQTFVMLEPARFLVTVAPKRADGQPDPSRLRSFLAQPGQGVTYGMDVWHHPMTVLDKPTRYAIFMWLARDTGDEEFVDLAEPVAIRLQA